VIIEVNKIYLIDNSNTQVYIRKIYSQTDEKIVFDGHHTCTNTGYEITHPMKYYLGKEFINKNWREKK